MRKPDPREIAAVAVPVLFAEAAVIVAIFLFVAITINGHAVWAAIVGLQ